jgi:hypothetical protein
MILGRALLLTGGIPCWLGVADARGWAGVDDVGLMADTSPRLVAEPGSRIFVASHISRRANARVRSPTRVRRDGLFENEKWTH